MHATRREDQTLDHFLGAFLDFFQRCGKFDKLPLNVEEWNFASNCLHMSAFMSAV